MKNLRNNNSQNIPKIGVSSKIFHNRHWYKDLSKTKIDVLEINARELSIPYRLMWLDKAKEDFKGIDLSLHSKTMGVFSKIDEFTEVELSTLKAEIVISKHLGIKEIVFHLSDEWDSKNNISELKKIFAFAKKNEVELIYESNAGNFESKSTFRFFEVFPEANYNLDLGHLNKNYKKQDFGCTLDEFIDSVKDRIVYIHAHNNDESYDQHRSINEGTLDWKHVFNKLDFTKIKIIIEVLTEEDYLKSRKSIEEYFKKRINKQDKK